jgi:spore maturation protein A
MLNYIWAGLIILSLVFALVTDVTDFTNDTYRNNQPLPVEIAFPDGYQTDTRRQAVEVRIDTSAFRAHYAASPNGIAESYEGLLVQTREGRELRFAEGVALPEPLTTVRDVTSSRDNDLRGPVDFTAAVGAAGADATIRFGRVRFVKMQAIAQAALDFAETAVSIALGLIGVMALWLGLLRIADTSGLIYSLVKVTQPVVRRLFPGIPKDHPALGVIVLNLSANALGLGNAATPLGIKAMEQLQTLNTQKDTATNDMVMLLAMNTASVQVVPPVLLVAIMGLQINQLFFAILIVTTLSLIIAIASAKLYSRLKGVRASEPPPMPPGTPIPNAEDTPPPVA